LLPDFCISSPDFFVTSIDLPESYCIYSRSHHTSPESPWTPLGGISVDLPAIPNLFKSLPNFPLSSSDLPISSQDLFVFPLHLLVSPILDFPQIFLHFPWIYLQRSLFYIFRISLYFPRFLCNVYGCPCIYPRSPCTAPISSYISPESHKFSWLFPGSPYIFNESPPISPGFLYFFPRSLHRSPRILLYLLSKISLDPSGISVDLPAFPAKHSISPPNFLLSSRDPPVSPYDLVVTLLDFLVSPILGYPQIFLHFP
jgi:hypothetical protein